MDIGGMPVLPGIRGGGRNKKILLVKALRIIFCNVITSFGLGTQDACIR